MSAAATAPDGARRSGAGPSVRAVVVSWEGAHLLPACLDALQAQSLAAGELEVVVVDNASTDGTAQLLAERYPDVRVVRSPTNLGFAGGANLGAAGFDGELLAFVNNDASLDRDALAHLRAAMLDPGAARVGAVTARILLAGSYRPAGPGDTGVLRGRDRSWVRADDGTGVPLVNSTGNVVHRDGTGGDRGWLQPATHEDPPDVFGFCGGAALLRTAALREVGLFDDSLFLYYEDTDLSWRLRAHGWQVRYVAAAQATHLHAASSGAASPVFRYHNTRNSLLVFTRHAPLRVVLGSLARQCAGLVRSAVREPAGPLTRARARALADYARALPRTLADRRRLWRDATVPRAEVARYLR